MSDTIKKYRITRKYDDYPTAIVLGVVGKPAEDVGRSIEAAWEEFIDMEPDSDSQFIDYLVENDGFIKIEDDFIDISVE